MAYLNKVRDELKRRIEAGETCLTIKYSYIRGIPQIITTNSKKPDLNLIFTQFSICYTNICSLASKSCDLTLRCQNSDPSYILISEAWVRDDIRDSVVSLSGYSMYRCDRVNRIGGGVGVYIKTPNLQSSQLYSNPATLVTLTCYTSIFRPVTSSFLLCVYIDTPAQKNTIIYYLTNFFK